MKKNTALKLAKVCQLSSHILLKRRQYLNTEYFDTDSSHIKMINK